MFTDEVTKSQMPSVWPIIEPGVDKYLPSEVKKIMNTPPTLTQEPGWVIWAILGIGLLLILRGERGGA